MPKSPLPIEYTLSIRNTDYIRGRRRKVSWDGKMYNKYKIEHTDGTPLKGKKYFVLRLDSDDPIEAARVARAMRAYEGKLRNCDVGTSEEQAKRFSFFCMRYHGCGKCDLNKGSKDCKFSWEQMPYEAKEGAE